MNDVMLLTPEIRAELLRRTTDYWARQCRWMAMDTTYPALAAQWNALPEATETCRHAREILTTRAATAPQPGEASMSKLFRPFTARNLEKYLADIRQRFDALPESDRDGFINPDEPIVLTVPNPEYDEDWCDEADKLVHFHVKSIGGGCDVDEDGNDCGHDGFSISGMEIDFDEFLYNGRRLIKKSKR